MSRRFGRKEFECDAPSYSVVKACEGLGFRSPLDVRWCRLKHFLADQAPSLGLIGWFLKRIQPRGKECLCGRSLPALERYTFIFRSERKAEYFLGQCRQCQTIFWDEAPQLDSGRRGAS
jgi:hypothetical protein